MKSAFHRNSGRAAHWAALFLFLTGFVVLLDSPLSAANFRKDKLTLKTASGEHVIAIEIAETSEQKSLGLMYRPKVPPDTGMLFPYGKPQEITMWMRNTYASLDMIFIRADGTVHRIEYATEPMSERIISSKGLVSAVLEMAAGEAKRLRIAPGDRVVHTSIEPRAR